MRPVLQTDRHRAGRRWHPTPSSSALPDWGSWAWPGLCGRQSKTGAVDLVERRNLTHSARGKAAALGSPHRPAQQSIHRETARACPR